MDENSNEKVYDAEPIKASETKQEATYTVSSESNDTASQGEYQNTTAKESSDPFNVASLVCGILGLLGSCIIGIRFIALILDILAIVFGVKAENKPGAKLGKAGKICGIIGICFWIFFAIIFFTLFKFIFAIFGEIVVKFIEAIKEYYGG